MASPFSPILALLVVVVVVAAVALAALSCVPAVFKIKLRWSAPAELSLSFQEFIFEDILGDHSL